MKLNRQGIFSLTSILLGFINIVITAIIYWALWSILYHKYGELLLVQTQVLSIGSKIEWLTKILGIVLGLFGLIGHGRRKSLAIIGILLNGITIIFTLLVLNGLLI